MGVVKRKNNITKKLIEIFEVSREHIGGFVTDPGSDYSKFLAGEDVTINDNIWVSTIYKAGSCIKEYKTVTISVHADDSNEGTPKYVRVTVVYDGFYDVFFKRDEWEMVLKTLRCIIDRPM